MPPWSTRFASSVLRLVRPLRQTVFRPALTVFWAGPCLVCDGPLPGAAHLGLCPACWASIRPLPGDRCPVCSLPREVYTDIEGAPASRCGACASASHGFRRLVAATVYRDAAVSVHRLYKFRRREELGRAIGRRMAGTAEAEAVVADLVVPVPRDPRRRRRPDPVAALAQVTARRMGLPLRRRALRKVRTTVRQTELPFRERRRGPRGAFRARRNEPVEGNRILLIDDVATTLATLEAASRALLDAGAREVTALTFARTPRENTGGRFS